MNKIPPNLTGKYIINPNNSLKIIGGIGILDGYYGGSSPSINWGTLLNGINNIGNEP